LGSVGGGQTGQDGRFIALHLAVDSFGDFTCTVGNGNGSGVESLGMSASPKRWKAA
jgi:hypothetical protein